MADQTEAVGEQIEPAPKHLHPHALHTVVVILWSVVGVFTGLGLVVAYGAYRLVEDQDLSIVEHAAASGDRASGLFVVAAVALGALAVVEAILVTLGHVEHVEEQLSRSSSA